MRKFIEFGEFGPDIANVNTAFSERVRNVFPARMSYIPAPSALAFSDALPSKCYGAFLARKTDGTRVFYAGTASKLYRLDTSDYSWTDVTNTGGDYAINTNDGWKFAQYQNKLLATNINEPLQVIDLDSGTNFADVSGSPPQARYINIVNEFVVLGNLESYPDRIHWSGLADITSWTPGTDSSDYQDFPAGGEIMALTGGEFGLVFQQDRMRRMTFTGSAAVFEFDEIERRGAVSADSVVQIGNRVFYMAEDGFYTFQGEASTPIGHERVNRYFQTQVDLDRLPFVQGAIDPYNKRVLWAYSTSGATDGVFDQALCYDWALDRWSELVQDITFWTGSASAGFTLDGLDSLGYNLDTLPFSLDSRVLYGGRPILAAFTSDHALAYYTGGNLAAEVISAEHQLTPGRRSFVTGMFPRCDATSIQGQIGGRENFQDTVAYTLARSRVAATGHIRGRRNAMLHRVKVTIPADAEWTHLQGAEIEFEPAGER